MTTRTLVIGSGVCATRVTEALVSGGGQVVVAGADAVLAQELMELRVKSGSAGIELLAPARLDACRGFVGNFDVLIEVDRQPIQREVASVIIAEDGRREANFESYGLRPTPRVRSLGDVTKALEENRDRLFADLEGRSVVFLDGLVEEGAPYILEEILRNALAIQTLPGARTVVLTTNLKVAAEGLEALYRKAKEAGTLFFKFTDAPPTMRQSEDGAAAITYTDETSGHTYALTPAITVVDERWMPSEMMKHLGNTLDLHTDRRGFLQAENVHRTGVFTNRRGILVCGPSRSPMGPSEIAADAAEAARAALDGRSDREAAAAAAARIDTGRCIRCLTCYRLCPHHSIREGSRMAVNSDACEGCGICAAECPRGAIELGEGAFSGQWPLRPEAPEEALVAFCCTRSAARARELAERSRFDLPRQLQVVEVPCAGALSTRHILDAVAGGAGGVLVLTCHQGNCHSETGQAHARRRVALLREQLHPLAAVAGRIEIRSLASNMAAEFAEIVRQAAQKLQQNTVQRSN